MEVLDKMEEVPTDNNAKPLTSIVISKCGELELVQPGKSAPSSANVVDDKKKTKKDKKRHKKSKRSKRVSASDQIQYFTH